MINFQFSPSKSVFISVFAALLMVFLVTTYKVLYFFLSLE